MSCIKRLSVSAIALVTLSSWVVRGDAQTDAPSATSGIAALCITRPNSAGAPATIAKWAGNAQLFDGLGTFHRPVTTTSADAQRYFDQGMRLLWAFNHDESTRSFAKASLLDPQCAMCFWGIALTVGPNYNLPMMAALAPSSRGMP